MKTTKEKHCQREKRNNQTIKHNPFPKTLLLQQSNTTTKEKQQHQQTQDPPRVLHGLDRTGFARVVGIGSELLELIGLDQWFSFTLSCSISLVPNWSSTGFCSDWVGLGFCWSWVLLEFVEGKNWTTKSSPIGSSFMLKSTPSCLI